MWDRQCPADIQDALALCINSAQHLRNVAGTTGSHVAIAPDELEHRNYIVVVFIFVSHRDRLTAWYGQGQNVRVPRGD